MIEPIKKSNSGAVQKANGVCDDCGRRECVTCDYHRNPGNVWLPDEGQVRNKLTAHGWSYVKNKLRCPACEAKRKVVPMKQEPKQDDPREPTKRQRIEIFTMLAECYDIDAGRYQQGDTDETVAEVLGVMPGWVAQIRDAEFGPDGGNENIEELAAKILTFEEDLNGLRQSFDAFMRTAEEKFGHSADKKLAEVSAMKAELDRIKKAVGPRVARVAGVK